MEVTIEDDKGPDGIMSVHSSCAMDARDFLLFPGSSCDPTDDVNEGNIDHWRGMLLL